MCPAYYWKNIPVVEYQKTPSGKTVAQQIPQNLTSKRHRKAFGKSELIITSHRKAFPAYTTPTEKKAKPSKRCVVCKQKIELV